MEKEKEGDERAGIRERGRVSGKGRRKRDGKRVKSFELSWVKKFLVQVPKLRRTL